MIFRDIERQIHPQRVINKVVFDLDRIMKQQEPGADDNCLLAAAKEQLKLGHARKPSNSRFVPRHTEIRYTVIRPGHCYCFKGGDTHYNNGALMF